MTLICQNVITGAIFVGWCILCGVLFILTIRFIFIFIVSYEQKKSKKKAKEKKQEESAAVSMYSEEEYDDDDYASYDDEDDERSYTPSEGSGSY